MKSKKHVHSSFIGFSVILSQLFTPSAQMIHIVYKGLFVSIDSNFLISNLNYTQKQNKKISMCRTLTPSDSKSQTFICSSMQVYDSQLGNRARRGEVVIFHLMFRGDQWSETQNINQCYSWLSIYFTKCTNHTLFQPPPLQKVYGLDNIFWCNLYCVTEETKDFQKILNLISIYIIDLQGPLCLL